MTYTIGIDKPALRLFKKLSPEIQRFLIQEARTLAANPYAGKQLTGKHRQLYSLHCSYHGTQYRIIYQVLKAQNAVIVRLAGSRENIYRQLEHMGK